MKSVDFKLHIAVDFGTDGCALAFAYKDKVTVYNKWRAQQVHSSSRASTTTKTKTQLILNENNEVTCFGNAAKFTYFNLEQPEQDRKKFFERFKMALYETHLGQFSDIIEADEEKKRSDVNTAKYLYDSKGEAIEPKIVFIAAFRMLQRKAKKYIPERITNDDIKDEEIQWIVTVPAIWSEKAKNKMRDWMIEATLIDPHVIDQCVIVFEPDCASLSMQKQYFRDITRKSKPRKSHSSKSSMNVIFNPCDDMESDEDEKSFKLAKKKINFEKNDKYILIDAGGGTVDIACHKIMGNGCVEEIIYPTGDKWGSCYIDDLYITLLQEIFTEQCIVDYQHKAPAGFVEVMANFKTAKETFSQKKAKTHRVHLPEDFVRFLTQECEKQNTDLATKINAFGASKQLNYFRDLFWNEREKEEKNYDECDKSVCVLKLIKERMNENDKKDDSDSEEEQLESDSEEENVKWIEYIELDVRIWKCLFDSKINPIIAHVEKLLEVKALSDCRFLGLVGGFSCSKYFQYRMNKAFGEYGFYQMTVVIPRNPMLTVVEGAALMAITQFTYIRARKLKYTYGIRRAFSKEYAKKKGISNDYINNQDNLGTDGLVEGCFDVVAIKNERVSIGTVKKSIGYRRSHKSKIPILKSDKQNPKVASEGEELAVLHVSHTNSKRETVTEFHFYDTIFKVYSYPKSNPNEKQQVHIKYVE